PVVVCYLEGKTYTAASEQLGWPVGTIATRLTQAREMLRSRLARRGLTVPGAGLLALLTEFDATAASPSQGERVLQGAGPWAAEGFSDRQSISSQAAALAEGEIRAMFLTRLKLASLCGGPVLAFGLLLAAGFGQTGNAAPPPEQAAPAKVNGQP